MSDLFVLVVAGLPLLALWLYAGVEVIRRHDLGGTGTVMWLVVLVFVPVVGLAIYVVSRPPRHVSTGTRDADVSTAEAIVLAAERRQRGETTDGEYGAEIADVGARR
jgi:uncharacterized membrane protein